MPFDRARDLRQLADERFDVLVVGGGITGAGVALDAATRGLRTALIDKGDFASGTSSKSSKLVHGGIRYLQQKEVGLVYEALAERQILRNTAPAPRARAAVPAPGLHPRRPAAPPPRPTARRNDVGVRPHRRPAHRQAAQARLAKRKRCAYMPTLPADNIAASYVYYDAQADDARLTLDGRADRGRPRRGGRELRDAHRLDEGRDGRVTGRDASRADGSEIDVRADVRS